jgi:hypothetical protein
VNLCQSTRCMYNRRMLPFADLAIVPGESGDKGYIP